MANLNQKNFDAAEDFPDLSKHNNFMARVLTKEIYAKYRDTTTPNGYSFDQAIQTGVDNPGVCVRSLEGILLTHSSLNKLIRIMQTFSNAFAWMKNFVFCL